MPYPSIFLRSPLLRSLLLLLTAVPAYTRLDLGFTWRPTRALEVGVWGQNLLEAQHPEFNSFISTFRGEVPRSFTSRLTWRF